MSRDDTPERARPLPGEVIVAVMMAHGVDTDDRRAVDAWIRAFNELSDVERAAMLPGGLFDEDDDDEEDEDDDYRRRSPMIVVVPDEAEARASAAASPLLALFRRLIDFLGDGRPATAKGNVRLRDARRLVELLDTGDVFDATVDDRTFKTRSAADLPNLMRIVRLAEGAGFVEQVDDKLVPAAGDRGLGDPLADLRRITEAVNRIGMVSAREQVDRVGWNDWSMWMDDRFGPMLAFLLDRPVDEVTPFDELAERAFDRLWDDERVGSLYRTERVGRNAAWQGIATAVETLELAGLVSWDGAEMGLDRKGQRRPRGGTVALTPGGRWTVTAELVEVFRMPISIAGVARFTDLDFAEIIGRTRQGPDDAAQLAVEVGAWLDRHGDDALALLEQAALSADDYATIAITLGVMDERFATSGERVARSLLEDRNTRGAALVWLVEREYEAPEALLDADPAVFADVLSVILERDGSPAMVDLFEHLGGADSQIEMLTRLWREPHPALRAVLTIIGRTHPSDSVAKAARKAALQHQTMLAAPDE
jgi:hypothetical protein